MCFEILNGLKYFVAQYSGNSFLMKKTWIFLFVLLGTRLQAQQNLGETAQSIAKEGKLLYQSEITSWHGSDLFLEKYPFHENIGGYFSYKEGETFKCVFFSKTAPQIVLGTISFDSTFNLAYAQSDLVRRNFSPLETQLYTLRELAQQEIQSDTLFRVYKNTQLNLVPLVNGKEHKVYVITGPKSGKVLLLGNDYLLSFDENNVLQSKKALHRNLIALGYGTKDSTGKNIEGTVHTHLPSSGPFISATDICTLMLYQRFTQWKSHVVVSEGYTSTWNCQTNELVISPRGFSGKKEKGKKKKKEKEKDDKD